MQISSTKQASEILKTAGVKPAVMNSEELTEAVKARDSKKPLVKTNKDAEALLEKEGVNLPLSEKGIAEAIAENAKEEEKEVENKAEKATKSKEK